MKKLPWVAAAALLIILMALGLGCSEKKSTSPGTEGGVSAIQIWLPTDTLRFLPGDSAIAEGWVLVKDQAQRGIPGVQVDISLTQPFGVIEFSTSTRDTSDVNGRVYFRFRSYNQTGLQIITASTGGRTDQWQLAVLQAAEVVADLTVSLSKPLLEIPRGIRDSVLVTVSISDPNGNGISDVVLPLVATGGQFAPLPPTNPSGFAETWWYFLNRFGSFTITVRAGGQQDTASITVREIESNGTLDLYSPVRVVRADRGVTRAPLRATLKNQHGVAVSGDTVYFAAPHLGEVGAFGITNNSGIALDTFQGGGVPSAHPLDSAYVIARYLRWGLVDTVRIFVAPAAMIETISLRASSLVGVAGVDSTALHVDVYYDDGSRVDNVPIRFFRTCGVLSVNEDTLDNGTVDNVYWKFCNTTTDDTTRALVWCQVLSHTSDTLEFTVEPGPARRIRVQAAASIIPINEQLSCWAFVRDSLNNLVRQGVPVMFTTTLGTLSPQSPVQTDAQGRAFVTLSPGTQAGQTTIRGSIASEAFVDSTIVTIQSGTVASIQLEVPNPSPQVRGTGGQDWTQILAYVKDANGNPAPDGQWVTFQILAAPVGCMINARGPLDSAQTAAGLATVTFNSGTQAGPVEIEARAFTGTDTIRARASNITVVAGPPNSIDIQPTDNGTDADGAAWDVVVSAMVRDVYNNPVRNGIAVFFEIQPDTASIQSDTVFTGNGPGRPGMAYTTLRYLSAATNQIVLITGRTAGTNSVSETVTYKLPIQQPAINLYCDWTSWHFIAQGDPCQITCTAEVRDGHNVLINGAKVNYSAQRGRLYLTCSGGTPRSYNFTGPPYHAENGKTSLCLREQATFIFPDQFTVEITGDVTVEVEGFSQAIDSQIINFRRGQGMTERGPVRGS
ncbi:Ig-like domain-containing protein [bacterium]|nr:Ig-like domain-containing protein [bacterium]MBU1984944.1 Ig-like domain-containing protein [bacterium]